jgi:hypothetical protein
MVAQAENNKSEKNRKNVNNLFILTYTFRFILQRYAPSIDLTTEAR